MEFDELPGAATIAALLPPLLPDLSKQCLAAQISLKQGNFF